MSEKDDCKKKLWRITGKEDWEEWLGKETEKHNWEELLRRMIGKNNQEKWSTGKKWLRRLTGENYFYNSITGHITGEVTGMKKVYQTIDYF